MTPLVVRMSEELCVNGRVKRASDRRANTGACGVHDERDCQQTASRTTNALQRLRRGQRRPFKSNHTLRPILCKLSKPKSLFQPTEVKCTRLKPTPFSMHRNFIPHHISPPRNKPSSHCHLTCHFVRRLLTRASPQEAHRSDSRPQAQAP